MQINLNVGNDLNFGKAFDTAYILADTEAKGIRTREKCKYMDNDHDHKLFTLKTFHACHR